MNASGKLCLIVCVILLGSASTILAEDKSPPQVYPTALLNFEERGIAARHLGPKVTDLLFASLANTPEMYLVDRDDLKKILDEQSLQISGAVSRDQSIKFGQLTGAKLLITGSVVQADTQVFLLAKIIGADTSRVVGVSVTGKSTDELGPLVGKLAAALSQTIADRADELVAKSVNSDDRLALMQERFQDLKQAALPSLRISIIERHLGQSAIAPSTQIELMRFARGLEFPIIEQDNKNGREPDVILSGEASSEFAGRFGNLVAIKGRLELKAVERKSGKVLAAERQTTVVVEVSEQVAGKLALQEAAAALAERILPKLTNISQ